MSSALDLICKRFIDNLRFSTNQWLCFHVIICSVSPISTLMMSKNTGWATPWFHSWHSRFWLILQVWCKRMWEDGEIRRDWRPIEFISRKTSSRSWDKRRLKDYTRSKSKILKERLFVYYTGNKKREEWSNWLKKHS